MRPIDFMSATELTATTRSEAISGITVMRIALTHSVPIGAMKSAARTSVGVPKAAMATPPATARARATRTRVLSFKINSDCYRDEAALNGESEFRLAAVSLPWSITTDFLRAGQPKIVPLTAPSDHQCHRRVTRFSQFVT